MNNRVTLALLLSFCTFLQAVGQTTSAGDQDDVVRITTNLVQIDAVVTKDGKHVRDLKAEDFEIYEDGRKQTITSFAYISNLPNAPRPVSPTVANTAGVPPAGPIQRDVARRTVAIVVDDLGMSAESMSHVRRQVRKFIAEEIQPTDLVAIIRTAGEMGALQQFTNDKRMLNRAVDLLRWNPCSRIGFAVLSEDAGGGCVGNTPERTLRGVRFILNAMGRLPGRKAMVLMSDDIPIRKEEPGAEGADSVMLGGDVRNYGGWLQRITETAIRSSVVIYSVDTQGLQYTGITARDALISRPPTIPGTAATNDVPARSAQLGQVGMISSRSRTLISRAEGSLQLAQRTGGFQVRNSNAFQLDRIYEDQGGYYLLGYRPTEETFNRKFHNIKAKVKRSGMTLRTRAGFYGVTEEEANRGRPVITNPVNLALLSPFGAQDLELALNSFFTNGKSEGSIIRSFIYLNAADLSFTSVNGQRETVLEVHGAVFGDNGAVIDRVKRDVVLSMGEAEFQQAMRDRLPDALRLRFDMPTKKAGSYQVRIAVLDRTSTKIGSAGQFVAVPDLDDKRLAVSGIVLRGVRQASTQMAVMANPSTRRFVVNSDLYFAFVVYNAVVNPATRLPNLTIETKLFRDGNVVGPSSEIPLDVKNQADLSRLFVNGSLRLNLDLAPGDYYLQVVITDKVTKAKQSTITQWVDFEIVK